MNVYFIGGGVCAVNGFFAGAMEAGLKKKGLDLAYIKSQKPCIWTGVFTSNKFKAAPIIDAISKQNRLIDGIIINSKNANAMTLQAGLEDVKEILSVLDGTWLMSSTGLIGKRLPKEKIKNAIKTFSFDEKNSHLAEQAILTTDSFPKSIALKVELDGKEFKIGAIAKGAGMIAPSLATTLCFVTTDINLSAKEIKECILDVLDFSFNAISVDGDMSTNDSIIVMSSQASQISDKEAFREALKIVLEKLALDVVKDGEGATKMAAFEVSGAKTKQEAKKCAKALANSLLVKTALFGEEPNWGRIASTIGACGITCDEKLLKIYIADVKIFDKGGICEAEEAAIEALRKNEFKIKCELGVGQENFIAYGCDLGYEYVKINAEYRT